MLIHGDFKMIMMMIYITLMKNVYKILVPFYSFSDHYSFKGVGKMVKLFDRVKMPW